MDNKPSLSQYFGESEVPPVSQFFDEIGTSPSDMIQSVYLGDGEDNSSNKTMSASFIQHTASQDVTFSNVLPTISTATSVPANTLPDPSTFFDTIGPEPQIITSRSNIGNPNNITDAMDGLTLKSQPVDKEADRRRDAWIPNDEARKTLMKAQSSPKGSFFPDREVLTMPGLVLEEELPDALQEVAVKYLGVSSAGSRGVVRAEHVTRDEGGLRELLRTGYLRAAVNLTAVLIGAAGQGVGRMHRPTKHTPRTLQLWLTRFAVMTRIKLYEPLQKEAEAFGDFNKPDMFYQVRETSCVGRMHRPTKHTPRTLQLWLTRFAVMTRIKLYEPLQKEAEAFGDFNKPDMFYQFYPDTYENRTGSLVPFALRLLVAELPAHVGRPEDSIDKLYSILDIVQKMVANLVDGKTEDGSGVLTSEHDVAESLRLWKGRETRVKHAIINCMIALKDYRQASKIIRSLEQSATWPGQRRAVHSALCRLALLAGDLRAAQDSFNTAQEERHNLCPTPDVREYVDQGLIEIAHGRYQEAYNSFARAADQEPTNIMVANNLSVCLLYMGRLKEAIAVLQKAINSDPERGLNESLLINLCTLYELESSKTNDKKLNLLTMLCKYKSDTIPNVLECLKLS